MQRGLLLLLLPVLAFSQSFDDNFARHFFFLFTEFEGENDAPQWGCLLGQPASLSHEQVRRSQGQKTLTMIFVAPTPDQRYL